jgi:hypothetical protein
LATDSVAIYRFSEAEGKKGFKLVSKLAHLLPPCQYVLITGIMTIEDSHPDFFDRPEDIRTVDKRFRRWEAIAQELARDGRKPVEALFDKKGNLSERFNELTR